LRVFRSGEAVKDALRAPAKPVEILDSLAASENGSPSDRRRFPFVMAIFN
jgi:hypothetical protein